MMTLREEIGVDPYGYVASDAIFLSAVLGAVKKRDGLIHGKYRNGGVCALGALGAELAKRNCCMCAFPSIVEQLQEVNDSVPWATPAEQRMKVIEWIEGRLKTAGEPA
jgi:hypothetical protein